MKQFTNHDLEQRLRQAQHAGPSEPPDNLHADIMRVCAAVRRTQPDRQPSSAIPARGWVALGAAVVVLALMIVARPWPPRRVAVAPPPPIGLPVDESLATARTFAERARTTAPLRDEVTRLEEDARAAAGFLLRNLPSI